METEKFGRIEELLSQASEKTYLRIENELLQVGINPHIDLDSLEQKLEKEITKTPTSNPRKILTNYGLTENYLENCKDRTFLKEVYHGLMNIPTNQNLFSNLNPTEIMALGYMSFELKNNPHMQKDIIEESKDENYSKIVAQIIGKAYTNPNIQKLNKIINKDEKPHNIERGMLIGRLHENVGYTILRDLTRSLLSKPYRPFDDTSMDSVGPAAYRKNINRLAQNIYKSRNQ